MKSIRSRKVVVLGVLSLLVLFVNGLGIPVGEASQSESLCGPGYCVGDCYCDNCLCYAPDTEISQRYCGGVAIWPQ